MTPEQLIADLGDIASELSDVVIATHETAGRLVLANSQPPVDTGRLAESGEVITDEHGFDIRYGAPYAPYVHAANPFLTRSLSEKESAVVDLYFDAVRQAVT